MLPGSATDHSLKNVEHRRRIRAAAFVFGPVLLAMACGGSTPTGPGPNPPANRAPGPGTIAATPVERAIATITEVSFSADGATDADGDPLSFAWSFGDGATATGARVTHIFANAGSFNVTLSVSDGQTAVAAPTATIRVERSLSGAWTVMHNERPAPYADVVLEHTRAGMAGTVRVGVSFAGVAAPPLAIKTSIVSGTAYPLSAQIETDSYQGSSLQSLDAFLSMTAESGDAPPTGELTFFLRCPMCLPPADVQRWVAPVTLIRASGGISHLENAPLLIERFLR